MSAESCSSDCSCTLAAADVRLLLLDVDGVLTDGHLLLQEDGSEIRRFHVHDGQGLVLLRDAGVAIGVISARRGGAAEARLRDLGITHMEFSSTDKLASAQTMLDQLDIRWEQTVAVGDDIGDVPLLAAAGCGVAVADARDAARQAADWVTPHAGGHGAVRDVCDWILKGHGS